jgi:CRP/FNR family transcriptional regulator, cyclic AMP receptor protein
MEDGLERAFDRLELGEPFLPKINNSANPLMERSAHITRLFARVGAIVTVTYVSEDNEVDFSRLLGPGFTTRFFAKGDTIFREGERGEEFFVVVRGQVEIRSGNRGFETLGRSGIFGEMALIDDRPRSASVVALTDVTVAPIKENQFLFLVKHTPFFALSVMRVLSYRLRRQNKAV